MSNETRIEVIKHHKLLIDNYLSKKSSICCKGSIEQYAAEQNNIENAIKIAVMSKDKYGKLHSHQKRIYKYVYNNFLKNLLFVRDEIMKAKNFDILIDIIYNNKPSGAGELFCYDVALRIGYKLNLLPEKVYIHAGTKIGLRKLYGRNIYEKTILKNNLPEPFNSCELTPDQLEDFFCIYKNNICGMKENLSSVKNMPLPEFC